jgi:hypothetical protein
VAANDAVITVDEGQIASNTGTWSDSNANGVFLTASVGTVTKNANGTWSWPFNATDWPSQSQVVTITATNSAATRTSTTFRLVVNNVPPVITALFSSSPQARFASHDGDVAIVGAFTDPGILVTHTVSVDWGDGTAVQTLTTVDQVNDLFVGLHHYRTSGTFTIVVTVSDNDGGTATATTTAVVAGVSVWHNAVANKYPDTDDDGGSEGHRRNVAHAFNFHS